MNIRDFKTIRQRRDFLEKTLKLDLGTIGSFSKSLEAAQFTNCENMIGAVQIPLGVAGPLSVFGQFAKGDFFIPLATTEGALVASVNRGCKAVAQSGGATVIIEDVGITRGPVFKTSGISESLDFKKWLDEHFTGLKKVAANTSEHLTLKKFGTRIVGKNVYARFYFDTSEAMGMNMATIATDAITKFIKDKTGIQCVSLAGNFDIDKKPAWLNFISGRGKRVWAEVVLPEQIIKSVLKTCASKIYEVWLSKCMLGSIMAGALGFNAHAANIISAIFIATGQDVAHTVEGSLGITTTEMMGNGLYISIYLPDLLVGTIGGGTKLPSQREALSIMGITSGKESDLKLAEIIAGAVLVGEISLLAALAQGHLASSHKILARGEK